MSNIDYHRHCQATVLSASGEPSGGGLTWGEIDGLNLGNLDAIWSGWKDELFFKNSNMTEDLAGILKLIDRLAEGH